MAAEGAASRVQVGSTAVIVVAVAVLAGHIVRGSVWSGWLSRAVDRKGEEM